MRVEPFARNKPLSQATLGDLLERAAWAQLPSRFYAVLQVGLPMAVQAWTWGWHRTAGWLAVVSVFGIWALARQHTHGHADVVTDDQEPPRRRRVWRVVRATAAFLGSIGAVGLSLEAFTRILAEIFRCPGCAG